MVLYYRNFFEDKIYNDCISIISSINEESSFDKIRSVWNKIQDKISTLSKDKKRKIIRSFVVSAIAIVPIANVIKMILNSDSDSDSDSKEEVIQVIDSMEFRDPTKLKLSQRGRDMIKDHEGYRSKAYKIGDGMITIGWGHAEPIRKSKYRIGQSISSQEANELLTDDLTEAADGIRRMFQQWKDGGDYVPVTQDMFDALVSLAYNSGISGVRNSNIAKELREKNYSKSGELIKRYKTSNKFKGLYKRRDIESKLFLSFLGT